VIDWPISRAISVASITCSSSLSALLHEGTFALLPALAPAFAVPFVVPSAQQTMAGLDKCSSPSLTSSAVYLLPFSCLVLIGGVLPLLAKALADSD
jgi:hypothetical protein